MDKANKKSKIITFWVFCDLKFEHENFDLKFD